jgi:hypothetical protein
LRKSRKKWVYGKTINLRDRCNSDLEASSYPQPLFREDINDL